MNHFNLGLCYNADSDLVGPGWNLRFFISNRLPNDAEMLWYEATLWVAGPYSVCLISTSKKL